MKEGRRIGRLDRCLPLACVTERMIAVLLSVSSFQPPSIQKKKKNYKLFLVQLWVFAVAAMPENGIWMGKLGVVWLIKHY